MPCHVTWCVDNRVISIVLSGKLTADEMIRASTVIHHMIELGDAPVHLIYRLSKLTGWPEVTSMGHVFYRGPKRGVTVAVNVTGVLQAFIMSALISVLKLPAYAFPTVESAWSFLIEHDKTLVGMSLPAALLENPYDGTGPNLG